MVTVRKEGWCPTHRKIEPCHADGRIACSEAWHDQLKLESIARIEKHRHNPEFLLEEIREELRGIRDLQEDVTTEPRPAPPPPPPRPPRPSASRDLPPPPRALDRGVAL